MMQKHLNRLYSMGQRSIVRICNDCGDHHLYILQSQFGRFIKKCFSAFISYNYLSSSTCYGDPNTQNIYKNIYKNICTTQCTFVPPLEYRQQLILGLIEDTDEVNIMRTPSCYRGISYGRSLYNLHLKIK